MWTYVKLWKLELFAQYDRAGRLGSPKLSFQAGSGSLEVWIGRAYASFSVPVATH